MQQKHDEDSASGPGSVSHVDLTQSREEILEYWTKQRMAEAKPRELRLPERGPEAGSADQD